MNLFNRYNSVNAIADLVNGFNSIITKATRTLDRKEDSSYLKQLQDFRDCIKYVTFNESSYKALIDTISEYSRKPRLSRCSCETLIKRAKLACSLKKGEELPDLTQVENYDNLLDTYTEKINEKSITLDKLHKLADHYLDTNNELAWNRTNADISLLESETTRYKNLFNAITMKKTNLAESLSASSINLDYESLSESSDGLVDVTMYEDNLASQKDIQDSILDEANQMARINGSFTKNSDDLFAKAKAERAEKLNREKEELDELIEQEEAKTSIKKKTQI